MATKIFDSKGKLSGEALERAERAVGQPLPEQYKRFLLENNGGYPEPASFKITWSGQPWGDQWDVGSVHYFLPVYEGDDPNFLDYFEIYKNRVPEDTIPIAYDPGGNLILLGISGDSRGKVFFWMQDFETDEDRPADYSNVGFVANSFQEFIDSLFDA